VVDLRAGPKTLRPITLEGNAGSTEALLLSARLGCATGRRKGKGEEHVLGGTGGSGGKGRRQGMHGAGGRESGARPSFCRCRGCEGGAGGHGAASFVLVHRVGACLAQGRWGFGRDFVP